MTDRSVRDGIRGPVTLWLDPVCPYTWNTARWLTAAAREADFDIDWRIMSLAILNEGRALPPTQQARMDDSRKAGRLMAALHGELGADAIGKAYVAFADQYFSHSASVDDDLVGYVTRAVGAVKTGAATLVDAALDATVSVFHQASQNALGETGGSPLLTIGGRTVFGPVFSAVPNAEHTLAVFDAVTELVLTPEFSQVQRPRNPT